MKKMFNSRGFVENTLLFLLFGTLSLSIPAITKTIPTYTSQIAQENTFANNGEICETKSCDPFVIPKLTCGKPTSGAKKTCTPAASISGSQPCILGVEGDLACTSGSCHNIGYTTGRCANNLAQSQPGNLGGFCKLTGTCNTGLTCQKKPEQLVGFCVSSENSNNCGDKNCSSSQGCVKSYPGSTTTECVGKNATGIGGYCGTPDNKPNNFVCGTDYCNSDLKCDKKPTPESANPLPADTGGTNEGVICDGKGGTNTTVGDKGYLGPRCGDANNWQSFDSVKAATKTFCGKSYADAWQCVNGSIDYRNYGVGSGNTAYCSKDPWCPTSTGGGTGGGSTTSCTTAGFTCDVNGKTGSACTKNGQSGTLQPKSGFTCSSQFCYECVISNNAGGGNTGGGSTGGGNSGGGTSGGNPTTCTTEGSACGGSSDNACYKAINGNALYCCKFTERFCPLLNKCVGGGTAEWDQCQKGPTKTPTPTPNGYFNPQTCNGAPGSFSNHCNGKDASGNSLPCCPGYHCNGDSSSGLTACVKDTASTVSTQKIAESSQCTKNSECKKLNKSVCVIDAFENGTCE